VRFRTGCHSFISMVITIILIILQRLQKKAGVWVGGAPPSTAQAPKPQKH
jgi:hypothetical protein